MTLQEHIKRALEQNTAADYDLLHLVNTIVEVVKKLSDRLRVAGLSNITSFTGKNNIHGDNVNVFDLFANNLIRNTLEETGLICAMVSEESDSLIKINNKFRNGKFVLAYDPLDGSNNINVNSTTASIFSIFERLNPDDDSIGTEQDLLRPGREQKFAAYALYGASTVFVYTIGKGTHVFIYDPAEKEFILSNENIRMPEQGAHYSCNEANYLNWNPQIKDFLLYLKDRNIEGHNYKQRYIATVAADIHRILHYGGIYLYPVDKQHPDGKIRLLYETNALAWIAEQAGGMATNGEDNLLDIEPVDIHQRTAFFIGSIYEIGQLKKFLS